MGQGPIAQTIGHTAVAGKRPRVQVDAHESESNPLTHDLHFRRLTQRHGLVAGALTGAMIVLYFGFVLLIAYNKPFMGRLITRGLTVGILLGALVIVCSWLLTLVYVRWANAHYDSAVNRLKL
ncbi:MAG: DUF485 domain-containing protein [Gemmatimonadaceae bacterium]